MSRRQESTTGRRGFGVSIDVTVADATRRAAAERHIQLWRVMEDALELGLPHIQPVGEPLPVAALDHTKVRGRETAAIFAQIAPHIAEAVRAAATARRAHMWWVAEEALRYGLPLLPAPPRTSVLAYDRGVLRQTA